MEEFDNVEDLVRQANTLGRDLDSASDRVAVKEVILFNALIGKVPPVMQYVAVPLAISYYRSGKENVDAKVRYYKEEGIVLAETYAKRKSERDYRGDYMGSKLCLTKSGKLVEIEMSGYSSSWGEDVGSWKAVVLPIKPPEIVQKYAIEEIIGRVINTLEEAIDRSEERIEQLGDRLEKLQEAREIL